MGEKDKRGILLDLEKEFHDKLALSAKRSGRSKKAESELRLMDHLLRYSATNKNIITPSGVEFEAIENDD
jgi:hypothetical protein